MHRITTFAQRRNRLATHFSERIPVVKRRISVFNAGVRNEWSCTTSTLIYLHGVDRGNLTFAVSKDLSDFILRVKRFEKSFGMIGVRSFETS